MEKKNYYLLTIKIGLLSAAFLDGLHILIFLTANKMQEETLYCFGMCFKTQAFNSILTPFKTVALFPFLIENKPLKGRNVSVELVSVPSTDILYQLSNTFHYCFDS